MPQMHHVFLIIFQLMRQGNWVGGSGKGIGKGWRGKGKRKGERAKGKEESN